MLIRNDLRFDGARHLGRGRLAQAGVTLPDYATMMVEILNDNARPGAGEVYGGMDVGWAKLIDQIPRAYDK